MRPLLPEQGVVRLPRVLKAQTFHAWVRGDNVMILEVFPDGVQKSVGDFTGTASEREAFATGYLGGLLAVRT